MTQEELLAATKALLKRVGRSLEEIRATAEWKSPSGEKAAVAEFFRSYVGPKSSFYLEAKDVGGAPASQLKSLEALLRSFAEYVAAGLHAGVSPARRAQLEVVSDLLNQSQQLLNTTGVHPAAPAMLIGATLEEYLRTSVEEAGLSIGNKKPGIQAYADALYAADLLSKQDMKDITAWGGIRNDAAHGEWDKVADPVRIRIMLEGVNLFMRRVGSG